MQGAPTTPYCTNNSSLDSITRVSQLSCIIPLFATIRGHIWSLRTSAPTSSHLRGLEGTVQLSEIGCREFTLRVEQGLASHVAATARVAGTGGREGRGGGEGRRRRRKKKNSSGRGGLFDDNEFQNRGNTVLLHTDWQWHPFSPCH